MALMVALGLMTGLQARDPQQDPGRHRPRQHLPQRAASAFEDYREVVEAVRSVPRRARARRPPSTARRCSPAPAARAVATAQGHRARAGAHGDRPRLPGRGGTPGRARRSRPTTACRRSCSAATSPTAWAWASGDVVTRHLAAGPPVAAGRAAAGDEVPRGGHGAQRPLRVRLRLGLRAARAPRSGSSAQAGPRQPRRGAARRHLRGARGRPTRILEALGEGYLTNDWIQMNQSLFSALWLEKIAIGITIGLIVMVAALNIVATLILMVMEKHKDIAILVSMGASRGAITPHLHAAGDAHRRGGHRWRAPLLGWGACRILDHYKLIQVPVDVYQISYVPFTLLPGDARGRGAGRRAHLLPGHAPSRPRRGAPRPRRGPALRMSDEPPSIAGRDGRASKGYRTAAGLRARARRASTSRSPRARCWRSSGPPGVGKSTLLHVLGTLDRPEAGTVTRRRRGRAPRSPETACARSATGRSGSCSSSTTCCPSSPRSRT